MEVLLWNFLSALHRWNEPHTAWLKVRTRWMKTKMDLLMHGIKEMNMLCDVCSLLKALLIWEGKELVLRRTFFIRRCCYCYDVILFLYKYCSSRFRIHNLRHVVRKAARQNIKIHVAKKGDHLSFPHFFSHNLVFYFILFYQHQANVKYKA
jgi:hypothetical protein